DALANLRSASCAGCDNLPVSQVEPSVAVHGDQVVVAFNDISVTCRGGSRENFAYSSDGGLTYTDAGGILLGDNGLSLYGDPAVSVNHKTGAFYIEGLGSGGFIGIGFSICGAKGHFSGSSFVLDVVKRVVVNTDPDQFYDRPYVAVDSLTGNTYFTWARFTSIANQH